jgi:hypothetical protein
LVGWNASSAQLPSSRTQTASDLLFSIRLVWPSTSTSPRMSWKTRAQSPRTTMLCSGCSMGPYLKKPLASLSR